MRGNVKLNVHIYFGCHSPDYIDIYVYKKVSRIADLAYEQSTTQRRAGQ
jgi:hypothetical protein